MRLPFLPRRRVAPGPGAGPAVLERFFTDLWTSGLVRGPRAFAVIALGVVTGLAVERTGWAVGLALVAAVAAGLVAVIVIVDRARWSAQDGYARYATVRLGRWVRETGAMAPLAGSGEAEVWLGAHRPGTVPQVYRVLAASLARDEHLWARELAALPGTTPADRAWRAYAEASHELDTTGSADTTRLAVAIDELPDDDRVWHRDWLALAGCVQAHAEGRPGWLRGTRHGIAGGAGCVAPRQPPHPPAAGSVGGGRGVPRDGPARRGHRGGDPGPRGPATCASGSAWFEPTRTLRRRDPSACRLTAVERRRAD